MISRTDIFSAEEEEEEEEEVSLVFNQISGMTV
jgi:hypothetical protein